ncbi:MAG: sel1 repeat family protein, partial [Rhodospirillales bacterium]|nr:sel1 repeat family protein [Rhodospirillales bacterium]
MKAFKLVLPAAALMAACVSVPSSTRAQDSAAAPLAATIAASPPAAPALDQGRIAFERGDHATAASILKPLAEQGQAEAQYLLGRILAAGRGLRLDYKDAYSWYAKAAVQGHAKGTCRAALLKAHGQGVTKDKAQAGQACIPATFQVRAAAEQGDADAQALLGTLLLEGIGLDSNDSQALTWLRKAADQGQAGAQQALGYAYVNGIGSGKDT